MRTSKQLLIDSRPYAHEHRATSWWCLLSTLAIFAGLEYLAVTDWPWPIRVAASVAAGLVMIRLFILYHDFEHGTILKRSPVAWAIMKFYGLLILNPPSIWRRSHNHHHKHNAKLFGASIGSFPVMTTTAYAAATRGQRFEYAVSRHPLTLAAGYVTVFLYGMCIRSLIANWRMHFDSAVSIVLHVGLAVVLGFIGWDVLVFGLLLPSTISAAMGAYLFYAQHNFPDVDLMPSGKWDYVSAAMKSSSYIEMGRFWAWVTGNIGYHHVHHLNHHIPFYRLPEAMAGLEELQTPRRTSLWPRDIAACLRLKVWDVEQGKLTPFPRTPAPAPRDRSAPAGSLASSTQD